MHSQNVWHRQLRAAACIVTDEFRAKIADFARAKAPGAPVITYQGEWQEWRWTAPEVHDDTASLKKKSATNVDKKTKSSSGSSSASSAVAAAPTASSTTYHLRHTSEKADIYSLGMLIYEVYVGKEPFERGRAAYMEFMNQYVQNRKLIRPQGGSGESRKWMKECWSFNPTQRPNAIAVSTAFEKMITADNERLELRRQAQVKIVVSFFFCRDDNNNNRIRNSKNKIHHKQ